MATDTVAQTPEKLDLVAVFRAAAAPETRDRRFWITLAAAVAVHSLILISLVRAMPRQIGDPNAAPEAVAVSFVSEAELMDRMTGAEGGPPPSPPTPQAQPATQPPPPQQQPQEAQPPQETVQPPPPPPPQAEPEKAEPAPEAKAEELAKAETEKAPETPLLKDTIPAEAVPEKKAEETEAKKETKAQPQPDKPVESPSDLAKDMPDLLQLPDPSTMQRPAQKPQQPAKQQKQAMRSQPNMTMPSDAITTPSYDGRSAGVQRPPGITRSGANDDFARGVVSALRKTMPQMNVLGRVTVRIILTMNGNIESVEVLAKSDKPDLDRAVVFSTKQAYFPFPPNGATSDDRTFIITYIYH